MKYLNSYCVLSLIILFAIGGCGSGSEYTAADNASNNKTVDRGNKFIPVPQNELISEDDGGPNQYIVVMNTPIVANSTGTVAGRYTKLATNWETLATDYNGTMTKAFDTAIPAFVTKMSAADAEALSQHPSVLFVEQDRVVKLPDIGRILSTDGGIGAAAVQANATPGLDRIDQELGPLDGNYNFNATGDGVNVYIIDTGILANHPEFAGRIGPGGSVINDGLGTGDANGHGTHVAGTVGGTNFGAAKGVILHPIRVLDANGSGSLSGVIAGVDFVARNHVKPAVANMSLGGGVSTALDNAVRNAISAGVVFVVAAGNETADACGSSPARVTGAITVGASNFTTDFRAGFSNFGSCVNLFAPGQNITSAFLAGNSSPTTATLSGTSMASPHVAGAAALLLETDQTLTPDQVFQQLVGNATKNQLNDIGAGSPNLLLFTGFIGVNDPTPPPLPPNAPPTVALATYDAELGTVGCVGSAVSCDSGTLLDGRAAIRNGPETNTPNTLQASCIDGGTGTYHFDESIDRIQIKTANGNALSVGSEVTVETTVYAFDQSDSLDLFHTNDANNPVWTYIGTVTPSRRGLQVLFIDFNLPAGGLQAVRANFRYRGAVNECTAGGFNDHDDVFFTVSP